MTTPSNPPAPSALDVARSFATKAAPDSWLTYPVTETDESPAPSDGVLREALERVMPTLEWASEQCAKIGDIDDAAAVLSQVEQARDALTNSGTHIKVEEADRSDWPQKSAEEITEIIRQTYLDGCLKTTGQAFTYASLKDAAYDYSMSVGPLVMGTNPAGEGGVRARALEEAARVAEADYKDWNTPPHWIAKECGKRIAASIRALSANGGEAG